MTIAEIIDMADVLTERKGRPLDKNLLLDQVLQDFCGRDRFWWRRKSFTWSTVVGTKTYDLSSITTTPASSMAETIAEEIVELGTWDGSAISYLTPVYDHRALIDMQVSTTNVKPGRYTLDANDYKTIRLDPPDAVYTMYITLWAMPNMGTGSVATTIPLVPPQYHKTLVDGLVMKIRQNLFGQANTRFLAAKADYEAGVLLAQARPGFSPNRAQQFTVSSDFAIRSTE